MITASSEFINDGIDVIIWNRCYIYKRTKVPRYLCNKLPINR